MKFVIFAPLEAPSGIGMEVITIFRFSDHSHLSDELLFWPQTHFTGRANVEGLGYSNKNRHVWNMPQSYFMCNLRERQSTSSLLTVLYPH